MGRNEEPTSVRACDCVTKWEEEDDLGPIQSHVMAGKWQGTSRRGLWKGGEVKRLTRSPSALPPPSLGLWAYYFTFAYGRCSVHALCKFGAENVIHSTLGFQDFKSAYRLRYGWEAREASVRSGMMAALCKERSERPSTLYAKSFRPNSSTPRPSRASQCILRLNGTCLVENVSRCN